ncbi:MAG: Wzy polymerase domain-containing protein [Pseudomonadota bacterium]
MTATHPRPPPAWILPGLTAAAAALPSLLAFNVSPSPTYLNQALALALWGLWAVVLAEMAPASPGRAAWPVAAALAALALGVLWSWGPGALPSSLALSALGLLAAAALLLASGAAARRGALAPRLFAAFCVAWVAAGLANAAIALVQVFAPAWPDGNWIAESGLPGRAVGNLRQPNHLSSLLLWSSIAVIALVEMGRLSRRRAVPLLALFVWAVVLTASRTGLLSVLLLALWGAADRRLAGRTRVLLLAAPLMYALAWWGMAQWAAASAHVFGGAERLAGSDVSSSRFGIWANTLELIRREPWLGVGFGEFNFAWTLTPFPGRPTAFFDHAHNLPLHVLAELGLPLGSAVLALLLLGLGQGIARAWRTDGEQGTAARAAMLMVTMIGLHSLLEYPLWYSYFLLPAAWAWGFALGAPRREERPSAAAPRVLAAACAALALGAVLSMADYLRVAAIFVAAPGAPPLEQRIADGQRSVLFAHHAHYAAVTRDTLPPDAGRSFAVTTHYLLDTRLMVAWARWLQASGREEEARHVAARLREFRRPDDDGLFTPCAQAGAPDFPCRPPARELSWREFVAPPAPPGRDPAGVGAGANARANSGVRTPPP